MNIQINMYLKACLFLAMLLINSRAYSLSHGSDTFVISLNSSYSTLDPQQENSAPNLVVAAHFFDTLFTVKENGDMEPNLASNAERIASRDWRIQLKKGVMFHDGSELTTKDVVYTFKRLKSLYGGKSLSSFLSEITEYKAVNAHQIELSTKHVLPDLAAIFENIYVLKASPLPYPKATDFLSGKAINGTGPYKFMGRSSRNGLLLKRFDQYHDQDKAPYLEQIELYSYPSRQERLKAFTEGNVHLIDQLTIKEIQTIRSAGQYRFNQYADDRLLHLYLDTSRDNSPYIKSINGQPMPNPLKILKVRQALSKAIDRNLLAEKIHQGSAVPAGQLVKKGRAGHNSALQVEKFDPEGAKRLLTESGYKHGFKITLHGPNDRYPRELDVLAAIAKMWTDIGVLTEIKTMSKSEYFSKAAKHEFSAGLMGYLTYGRIQDMLTDLLILSNKNDQVQMGAWNTGAYNNPEVTKRVTKAMISESKALRLRLLKDAAEIAIKDQAIIPLYFPVLTWATNRDVVYWPDSGNTHAKQVRPSSTNKVLHNSVATQK